MGIALLHPRANRLSGFHYRVAGTGVVLPRGGSLIPLDDIGLPIHGAMPSLMRWEVVELSPTSRPSTTGSAPSTNPHRSRLPAAMSR
jgi:aldose 1-epimerase